MITKYRTGLLVLASALICATAQVARAYVRTRPLGMQTPARWSKPQIHLAFDPRELPAGWSEAEAFEALTRAARTWSAPALSCTAAEITIERQSDTMSPEQPDGRSTIGFHTRYWCSSGVYRAGECYDEHRAAVTTLHYGPKLPNGEPEIVEADVELNAVQFAWTDAKRSDRPGATPALDLEAVALHELGHALGLAHVCEYAGRFAPQPSTEPHATPRCENAAETLATSVMRPGSDSGLTARTSLPRTLGSDDRAALCEIYPGAKTQPATPARACDCNLSRRLSGGAGIAFAAVLAQALRVRRHRRGRSPSR